VRVLVTGASGFAGGWLCRSLRESGDAVVGVSRSGTAPDGAEGAAVDLRDAEGMRRLVRRTAPEVVYHLAALSNVGRSWSAPGDTLSANAGGAAALLEALRSEAPGARIVWVSSSEVYGTVDGAIGEDVVPVPESPYAVSKLTAEQLATVYARAHGLRVVIARPFSHSGPGQRSLYLLSNLCRQAAEAVRAGARTLRIVTGNPDTRRDFTDVRDVVRAYRALAASDLEGVFNVCSGTTRSTAEHVAELGRLIAPVTVEHVVDPGLVRASEVMELRGDPRRLRAATGWQPAIAYPRTLADTLAHWDRTLAATTRGEP
jgi:GDP-4-dehydro-6-deoxy-D-mannose reductase